MLKERDNRPDKRILCWLLCSSTEVKAIFDVKFARLGRVLRRKTGTQGGYTTNQTHNR
jgi:hypothetical protein